MKATSAEVSRADEKDSWLVRIQIGEEVIKRHIPYKSAPAESDAAVLEALAVQTAKDEGYDLDVDKITVHR